MLDARAFQIFKNCRGSGESQFCAGNQRVIILINIWIGLYNKIGNSKFGLVDICSVANSRQSSTVILGPLARVAIKLFAKGHGKGQKHSAFFLTELLRRITRRKQQEGQWIGTFIPLPSF